MELSNKKSLKERLDDLNNCIFCGLRQRNKDGDGYYKEFKPDKHEAIKEQIYYTIYHDESDDYNANIMLITQNPGIKYLKSDTDSYNVIQDIQNANDDNTLIETYKDHMFRWLSVTNKDFYEGFIKEIRNVKNAELDSLVENYNRDDKVQFENQRQQFFNKFIVTDLIKCRGTSTDLDKIKNCGDACFSKFLEDELKKFKRNTGKKLVILFGTRVWKVLKEKLKLELVDGQGNAPSLENITDSHGYLFTSKDSEGLFFIPLVHLSQRTFSTCIRDSYFYHLERGLESYNRED